MAKYSLNLIIFKVFIFIQNLILKMGFGILLFNFAIINFKSMKQILIMISYFQRYHFIIAYLFKQNYYLYKKYYKFQIKIHSIQILIALTIYYLIYLIIFDFNY